MNATATLARATLGGAFTGNRTRLALATLAIALGVALGFAVQAINHTALTEFTSGLATLAGDADYELHGPRAGFDESVFAALVRDPAVAVASPVVEVDARLPGQAEALRIVGVDAFRAAMISPALLGAATDRLDTLRPDAIFLSPAAAAALGMKPGDPLAVQAGIGLVRLRVAGTLNASANLRYAVMDIAAVQDHFARRGLVSRIDLRLRPGADAGALRERIEPLLPAGVALASPAALSRATARMSRAYRVNLDVLALVALATGGLLVFSTQALAVMRRRAQFALLRTLGLTRARLTGLVLAEGALVGFVGAIAGLLGGFGLAAIALAVFGADLGAGYFRGVTPDVRFDPLAAALFVGLGIAAAMAGSVVPAREASRAPPAAALRTGDRDGVLARPRPVWPGLACLAGAAALVGWPPVDGLPLAGYAAIALLLVGTLLLLPRITAGLLASLPRPRRVVAALALDQLRGAPGQAAMSLAAIVASVALMVSMAIMVASFRHSLESWLDNVLPAELYVRAGLAGDTAYFDSDVQRAIATAPGVRQVEFLRVQRLVLDPERPPVTLLARDANPEDGKLRLPLVDAAVVPLPGAPPPLYASEAMADLYRFVPGSRVVLPIGGRGVAFTVAGLWRDYARQTGAVAIDRRLYIALTGDRNADDAALWLAPGADVAALRRDIAQRTGGADRVTFATPGDIRTRSLAVFDRTFAVTYALEAAAVGIGLVALSATFGALTLGRRREFGMLRHLGMTRRQIGAMLACEGALVSGVGLAAGLVPGFVISLILIYVVNRQSFHWGMSLHMPWLTLAVLSLTLLALATLTAVASARGAMGGGVVRAVQEDW